MRTLRTTVAVALLGIAAAAVAHEGAHGGRHGAVVKEQKDWGMAADRAAARRTIEVVMGDDMKFSPDRIDVKQGETMRIVVKNRGRMLHEFVLGTPQELQEHAALMLKFPDMHHDEPYMVHVAPGESGEMVWTFNRAGDFDFACLVPGHYQAGMRGKVHVAADEAAQGEIRKIDRERGTVTLRHGEIRSLDMPPMTMVYEVREPKVLDGIGVGDKVRFHAEHKDGKYVLRDIQRVQ